MTTHSELENLLGTNVEVTFHVVNKLFIVSSGILCFNEITRNFYLDLEGTSEFVFSSYYVYYVKGNDIRVFVD